jgi:hypothetical protein
MTRYLFVGGPAHSQRRALADPPPATINLPQPIPISAYFITAEVPELPGPCLYQRRRFVTVDPYGTSEEFAYFSTAAPDWPGRGEPSDQQLANALLEQQHRDALPWCVAPRCNERGWYKFLAAEYGRFAGRWWKPSEEIRLCPRHASDVYNARYMPRSELPEWLAVDATNLDPLKPIGLSEEMYSLLYRILDMREMRPDQS